MSFNVLKLNLFSYPIDPPPQPVLAEEQSEPTELSKGKHKRKKENPPVPKDSLISHPSTSNGTLILGHTSLLTTFILSHDEKYIITADRDEHIRVSWYPQGYTIESFCLGSTQYAQLVLDQFGFNSYLQIRVSSTYTLLLS